MLANFVLFIFIILSAQAFAQTTEELASHSSSWLHLYQYKKNIWGHYKSDIVSDRFFFSPEGKTQPLKELLAAKDAFSQNTGQYGTLKLPAACTFPARKMILEKLLKIQFPSPDCPDLKDWQNRIDANSLNIVFAGAYAGNPASILGHTFLRFYNDQRESKAQGIDLLSYSVGFTAVPDGDDNKLVYSVKGLTGAYPGFYEIEHHYMKVGLYNNSESRDLWEWKLKLPPEDVDLLVKYLWELSFNAQFKYYFADENCSYRLVKMLELVKPDLQLSSQLSMIVLPAETIRSFKNHQLLEENVLFRSSIKRKMHLKINELDENKKNQFNQAKLSSQAVKQTHDPTVLDALIDYWTYENYQKETHLNPHEAEVFEATFSQTAASKETSQFQMSDQQIQNHLHLVPPVEGHKPQWLNLSIGESSQSEKSYSLQYRNGVHPKWQSQYGYDNTANIEFLGFDLEKKMTKKEDLYQWNLLLAEVQSIENFFSMDSSFSWSFKAGSKNQCWLCKNDQNQIYIQGAFGLGYKDPRQNIYLMAHIESSTWVNEQSQTQLAPGFVAGYKNQFKNFILNLESQQNFWKNFHHIANQIQVSWNWQPNEIFFLKYQEDYLTQKIFSSSHWIGYAHFFE